MKIIFLGTNGWYDTETGSTPCILIETVDRFIVLDAGFGFYKVKKYVTSKKPVSLFISHLHYDHLIGLHTLPIFKLDQGIDIYANKIIMKGLKSFLKRPYTSPVLLLPTKVRFHTITGDADSPVKFETARMRHSVPCHGYKFYIEGKTVTYCTDTGLCNGLEKLAGGADLLITECAMAPGDKSPNIFHITPETAAEVAARAGAKKLALCHFDPAKYPTIDSRKCAQDVAKAIFKETVATSDGMVVEV
ncbi:MAG: ribonuclease Z [Candidatus Omnitrophota bacterium]|nr:ribonuclease Z [Candidatus Omnitrophota bacterium]